MQMVLGDLCENVFPPHKGIAAHGLRTTGLNHSKLSSTLLLFTDLNSIFHKDLR